MEVRSEVEDPATSYPLARHVTNSTRLLVVSDHALGTFRFACWLFATR